MTRSLEKNGIVAIALDTELAWGVHDKKDYSHLSEWHGKRENISGILNILEEFSMPVTWAIVGHLFLSKCDGMHFESKYPAGWFSEDPGTCWKEDPLWYAPDIVKAVLSGAIPHDIGLHGFSHVLFSGASRGICKLEMEQALDAAEALGVRPRSFVYPREGIGWTDLLKEFGIKIFRRPGWGWYHKLAIDARMKKLIRECFFVTPAPRGVLVQEEEDLYSLSSSCNLCGWGRLDGAWRQVYQLLKVLKLRLTLRAASLDGGIVLLDAHPHNFQNESDLNYLSRVLSIIDSYVTKRGLRIHTMIDIYERVRRRTLSLYR